MDLVEDVSLHSHLELLAGVLCDKVPDVLSRGGLMVLVQVEDLLKVMDYTFLDILRFEASLFIISQECKSILNQYLSTPCYHLYHCHLPDVIQLCLNITHN